MNFPDGHLAQIAQDLGRLGHKKLLLPPVFAQRAQRRQLLRAEAQPGELFRRERVHAAGFKQKGMGYC